MDFIVFVIMCQYMYLGFTYLFPGFFSSLFDRTSYYKITQPKKITKFEIKRYFIPLVGVYFLIKDWYIKLE